MACIPFHVRKEKTISITNGNNTLPLIRQKSGDLVLEIIGLTLNVKTPLRNQIYPESDLTPTSIARCSEIALLLVIAISISEFLNILETLAFQKYFLHKDLYLLLYTLYLSTKIFSPLNLALR